jgi:hypothetical protein
MAALRFRHDPYTIFRASRTPPGLYARQKWLHQASSSAWRADFDATVAELYQGQSADGLWNDSVMETIHRLFGLHLTVRNPDPRIDAALDRLLEAAAGPDPAGEGEIVAPQRLFGLPFASSRRPALVLPASLFLASIFGRQSVPVVMELYRRIASRPIATDLGRQDPAVIHNLLRAWVVHPDYAGHAATRAAVDWLARRQTPSGHWGDGIPFFQALNALAHLKFPDAEAQCSRAFDRLAKIQGSDGAWGQTEPEWCTFLAIHALRQQQA